MPTQVLLPSGLLLAVNFRLREMFCSQIAVTMLRRGPVQ